MFETFRRYQKTGVAALAILAMVAFVFAGFFDSFRQSGSGGDETAATIDGKPVSFNEIRNLSFMRQKANEFMRRAFAQAKIPQQAPLFPTGPDDVIASIALVDRAQEMKIQVSNEDVLDWLNRMTQEKVSAEDYRGLLSGKIDPFGSASSQPIESLNISDLTLFEILRRELTIERLLEISLPPVATMFDNPVDLWERESPRLTEISLQFVGLPVSKNVDESATPNDQQLKETYNQYATVEPDAATGQAGFLQPRRVAIQYLVGKPDQFVSKVEVTDEEIQKYYDENKESFTRVPEPKLDESAPAVPPPPADVTPPADSPPPPSTEPAPAENKPAESASPQEEKPADSAPPAEDKPAEAAPLAEPAPEEGKNQARRSPTLGGTLRAMALSPLVSYQETPAAAESEPAPADPPAPPAETPTTPVEPVKEDPPADPAPAADADPAPAADAASAPAADAAPPAPSAPVGEANIPPAPKPPEIKPLDEVKEEIRQIIARQKANQLVKDEMQKIFDKTLAPYMISYRSARRKYEDANTKDGTVDWTGFEPPPRPDYAKIAADNGFELKESGLLSSAQIETLGGLSTSTRVDRLAGRGAPESFPNMVFGERIADDLFAPRIVFDSEAKLHHLYWKTEDRRPEPLPMNDVKEELAKLWRLDAARPKSKEQAEAIAKKATEAQGNLEASLSEGQTVESTEPFPRVRTMASDLTPGREQTLPVRIAKIPGAGESFLDEVFKHKEGEIFVLPDDKKENYYVVKIAKRTQPDFSRFARKYRDEMNLRRQFAQYVGQESRAAAFRQIIDSMKIDPPLFRPRPAAEEAPEESTGG